MAIVLSNVESTLESSEIAEEQHVLIPSRNDDAFELICSAQSPRRILASKLFTLH